MAQDSELKSQWQDTPEYLQRHLKAIAKVFFEGNIEQAWADYKQSVERLNAVPMLPASSDEASFRIVFQP